MKRWLKKLTGLDKIEAEKVKVEEEKLELLRKKNPKEYHTRKKQSWVNVLDMKVNEDNIRNGFFELDWNEFFIRDLRLNGYQGDSEEQIVDAWFKELCGNVAKDEGVASTENPMGAGYINTKNIGNNKSEVS